MVSITAGESKRPAGRFATAVAGNQAPAAVRIEASDALTTAVCHLRRDRRVRAGWHIELHSFSWADPTAGLRGHRTDAAFVWLPVDGDDIAVRVLAAEPRYAALSAGYRLAGRREIKFADIAAEPCWCFQS
jgi:hypothetical protein